jgi:hypothetical protein
VSLPNDQVLAALDRHQHWSLRYHWQSPPDIRATIHTLLKIRLVEHQPASILMLIPNELMIYIFERLVMPSIYQYLEGKGGDEDEDDDEDDDDEDDDEDDNGNSGNMEY